MEVILEVERGDGTRSWHRVASLPFSVGRGYANDLILDDPYVDARHASLARDDSGALVLLDHGTVNGVVGEGGTVRGASVAVAPGDTVRVGRTTLRVRAVDEAVAPALLDTLHQDARPVAVPMPAPVRPPAAAPVPSSPVRAPRAEALARLATTPAGSLALTVLAMAAFALNGWLGSATRASASEAFGGAFGFIALAAVWAGAWALAGRVAVRRLRFVAHMGVAAAGALGALAATIAIGWLTFLFPDATLVDVVSSLLMFGLLASVIVGHLALASTLPARRRWRNAGLAVGTMLGVGMLGSLTKADDFSDVPSYPGVLKPMPAAWVPTRSVDEFGTVMRELRKDADELAAEQQDERPAGARDSTGR